ncbi:MAG: DedA family protein, partial [Acidimicrobiales bacterium]
SDVAPGEGTSKTVEWRLPSFRLVLFAGVGIVVALWIVPLIASLVADIDIASLSRPYSIILLFVTFDAVIPIFPSESLLTTASSLAAQSGSEILIWRVFFAGAFGAIIGDSLLYWLSRTVLRRTMASRVEAAERNPKMKQAMQVLDSNAALIIVFGRFVPGIRFLVGATMGLSRYPFKKFLLYNAIGGTLWAGSTVLFSYVIASVLDDKPVISIVLSVIITTGLLALLFKPLKASWEESAAAAIQTGEA